MKLEFFRQIFEKISNIKFHKNPSRESRVVLRGLKDGRAVGRSDMKLIVAFRNFVNALENNTCEIVVR